MTDLAPSNSGASRQKVLAAVILAREADFVLGHARIRPSMSQVIADGQTIKLQHRVMQVLVVLARADGEVVSREDLLGRCWGGVAVADDAINRCIGRLRRLAEVEAPGAFAIETLARIGYRLTAPDAAHVAEPPALCEAPSSRRRVVPWRITAGGIVVILVAGAWVEFAPRGAPVRSESVAIMPFDTAPGDVVARNFADGAAAELASTLSQAEVETLSPGPGQEANSLDRDATAVQHGVAFALGARVQRDGGNLSVSIILEDPRIHLVLWSANFSRSATEARALQEQVAVKTAYVLRCLLDTRGVEGGGMDRLALPLYLRACDLKTDMVAPDRIRDLLRQVVRLEPKFSNAWAMLSLSSNAAADGLPPDQAALARREAQAAARRAVEIDPRNGLAYLALYGLVPAPGRLAEREALALKALSLTPDARSPDIGPMNSQESELLEESGRVREAVAYARRAESVDPLSSVRACHLANILADAGAFLEARGVIDRAARIWPDNDQVLAMRIMIEAWYGDPDRALALLDDPRSRPGRWEEPDIDERRRFIAARKSGDPAKLAAYAQRELAYLAAGKVDVSRATMRLISLGAIDAAFAAASRSTPSEPLETAALFTPPAESMRRDPRFMPLAMKLGLVDFWRRSGKWPDFCEAPDRPYDCRAAAERLTKAAK